MTINCSGRLIHLSSPVVMGVLNVTTDSFFDGGKYTTPAAIVRRVAAMMEEGAAIIDVGAASTRPGARPVPERDEAAKVCETVRLIRTHFQEAIISVDTYRAVVARNAIESGADMINDISGGTLDDDMEATVCALNVPYILTHIQGNPATMQAHPEYTNVVLEVAVYFAKKIDRLRRAGLNDIILDPGFGFGKTIDHNYELLNKLNAFGMFELPLLVGVSRKSMVCQLLGVTPEEALNGTSVVHAIALQKGASILRVHDVRQAVEAVKIYQKLQDVDLAG